MVYSDKQKYWIWLSSALCPDCKSFYRLLDEYGEAEYVWNQLVLAKRLLRPSTFSRLQNARTSEYMDNLMERLEKRNVVAVTQLDDEYPDRLRAIAEAPPTVYLRGDHRALNPDKAFAIVGSRKATVDGMRFVQSVACDLSRTGVCIVSGLAAGIDTHAHMGCLEGGAPTLAVLGSGPDIIYPPENRDLAARIIDEGGALLAEYPPGYPPADHTFPRRNRIIVGLSDGVLMGEGTLHSGAMITMRYAREQRRPRFAVPGSVYAASYEGTNHLLLEGAQICLGARQVTDYYGWRAAPAEKAAGDMPELDGPSLKIVEMLKYEEKSFDELANAMKMDVSSLNSLLTILEMQGIIRQAAGKMYRAIV